MNMIRSKLQTTIIPPSEIYFPKDTLPLMDTLGVSEYEEVAANFVACSQDTGEHGGWIAFVYPCRREDSSIFMSMVEVGLLNEQQVEDGWLYELSHVAIETIYMRQTKSRIRNLEEELCRMQRITFGQYLSRWFKGLIPA